MITFEGRTVTDKTSGKPKTRVFSKAFNEVENPSMATHIKLLDKDEFIEITPNLIIKRKIDANGNSTDDPVKFSDMKSLEQYVCVVDDKEVPISSNFYAQIIFMKKSANGTHYRCEDGVYVHKDEIQVPSYQKVELSNHATLEAPIHNNEFYVQTEAVILPNGTKITLPNDRVMQQNGEWLYKNDDGSYDVCSYTRGLNERQFVKHLLLDGNKVVDIRKLETKPNGDYILRDVEGEDIVVGTKEVVLDRPFIEGSSSVVAKETIIPSNLLKQRPLIEQGNTSLAFVWKTPDPSGLVRVDVSRNRTKVTYTYADGHKEVYAQHHVILNLGPNDKEFRVQRFNIIDLGGIDGVKIEFIEKTSAIARNVEFKDGKPSSYTLNDNQISDIKWQNIDGYDTITEYTIDGVRLSNIEWRAGEIRSCYVHAIDEDGNEQVVEVTDFRNSIYSGLGITYKLTEKIDDVKVDGETFSFKMGDYKFSNVELNEDGTIGKCKLKYNGKEEEIDLSQDPRFEQLKMVVKVSLDEQRIIPLVQSKLMHKEDGQYHLDASVVQTEAFKDGVAQARQITTVGEAVEEQEKFKSNKFRTVVIDSQDPNKTHEISDFTNTYEGSAEFEQDNSLLIDFIGKNKIEVKNGQINLDHKKTTEALQSMLLVGIGMCGMVIPFGMLLGIPMIAATAGIAVVAPIVRTIKKALIKNRSAKKVKQKMQDMAKNQCRERINNLVDKYKRELKAYKRMYSQAEFEKKSAELREAFRFEYRKEIARLQMLGKGAMKMEFDGSKKNKLTKENYLAYLEYEQLRKEFKNGKSAQAGLKKELKEIKKDSKRELKSATTAEQKRQVKVETAKRQVDALSSLGGISGIKKAYRIMKSRVYMNATLDEENKERRNNGEPELSKKEYKKYLRQMFNESRELIGGMKDKVKAYKESFEYQSATRKERRQLLKGKKQSLVKELNGISITSVAFEERVDKKGNSVAQQETRNATTYFEYAEHELFDNGNTKHVKKYTEGFYDGLSADEKEFYAPQTTLSEATARVITVGDNRQVEHDRQRNANQIQITTKKQQLVRDGIQNLSDERQSLVRRAIGDYEAIVELAAKVDEKQQIFETDCAQIEQMRDTIPYPELETKAMTEIETQLQQSQVEFEKQKMLIERARKDSERQYQQQVRETALSRFAEAHSKAYERYIESMDRNFDEVETSEFIDQASFFTEVCRRAGNKGDLAEHYKMELETYKVESHIDDNVYSQLFAETNKEELARFVEDYNAQNFKPIDVDSEFARCAFYAHWKKQNPLRIQNFERYNSKRFIQRRIERMQSGQLVKRRAQQTSQIQQPKKSVKSRDVSTAPVVTYDEHEVAPLAM